MNLLLRPSKYYYTNHHHHSLPPFHHSKSSSKLTSTKSLRRRIIVDWPKGTKGKSNVGVRACYNINEERKGFLSLEEAGLVEISGLNTHERFLCRLTISSLNLLRVISEQEGCPIEELNAGKICDWFLKDKLKREQNIGSAVLQWDDDDPFEAHF